MPKVFISHSADDRDFVECEIIAALHQAGIETWYSQHDVHATESWERSIHQGLKDCEWFLLVMSPSSEQSEWVRDELHWAMNHRRGRIVPVLIEKCEPCEFHIRLPRLQCVDFSKERDQARATLLNLWCVSTPLLPKSNTPAPNPSTQPNRTPSGPDRYPRRRRRALAALFVGLLLLGIISYVVIAPLWNSPFIGMKLVPAGSFEMGSHEDDKDAKSDEKPRHLVTISRPFYLGKHEVTQFEYERVTGENPSYFSSAGGGKDKVKGLVTDRMPVDSVSWIMAVKFCNALSLKEGLTPFYTIGADDQVTVPNWDGTGYRLPTEAEWEYACRAGNQKEYSFGDDPAQLKQYAWYGEDRTGKTWYGGSRTRRTHRVDQKEPNTWGLCDMHGNVSEWCWDWYDVKYYKSHSSKFNPVGPVTGTDHFLRGGCCDSPATSLRSAYRGGDESAGRLDRVGFRLARTHR